jgi:tetratricopeptide (TPR) repeat protein
MNNQPYTSVPATSPVADSSEAVVAAERLAADAHAAFLRGDARRVRACLGQALELAPSHGELALALGHSEMNAGNLEAALAAYWSATLRSPNLAAAHSNHALVLQLLGRHAEALRDALRAVSLDPKDIVGLKVLARIHLKAGQHEAALQACKLVLEQDDLDGEARRMLEQATIHEAMLGENLAENAEQEARTAKLARRSTPPVVKPPKATARSV